MTTIAANHSGMAADSLAVDDSNICVFVQKLYQVGDAFVGFAGSEADGLLFVEWAKGGYDSQNKPDLLNPDQDFEALVLDSEGLWYWPTKLVKTPVSASYYAIGSGAGVAMGAMAAGADPQRAVEIACVLDLHTGGTVKAAKL